jgi:hypothetical protein
LPLEIQNSVGSIFRHSLGTYNPTFQLIWLKYSKVMLKMVYFVWNMYGTGTSNGFKSKRKWPIPKSFLLSDSRHGSYPCAIFQVDWIFPVRLVTGTDDITVLRTIAPFKLRLENALKMKLLCFKPYKKHSLLC